MQPNETTNQMQQLITGLLLDVEIQLVVAVLLVVVGPAGPTTTNSTVTTMFQR
jgi:hypothetical protein